MSKMPFDIPVVMEAEAIPQPSPESKKINPYRVGDAAQNIIRAALHIHHHLILASDHAAPRLRALELAAGPWKKHNFTKETWVKADAIILAESFESVLDQSGLIRGVHGVMKRTDDKTKETRTVRYYQQLGGRPNCPFISSRGSRSICEVQTSPSYEPSIQLHLPGWPKRNPSDGEFPELVIHVVFDSKCADATARGSKDAIFLGQAIIEDVKIPAQSRTLKWHCSLIDTIAHELAHVWQLTWWKNRSAQNSPSNGGTESESSPHSARILEPFANACGYAAYCVGMGRANIDADKVVRTLDVYGSTEREMWVDWARSDFAKVYPREAHAADLYRRFFKLFMPIFEREFSAVKPIWTP